MGSLEKYSNEFLNIAQGKLAMGGAQVAGVEEVQATSQNPAVWLV